MLLKKISAYQKEIRVARLFLPILNKIFDSGKTIICWLLYYPYLIRHRISSKRKYKRLHVGCGKNYFKKWLNADIELRADLIVFLQKRLPFKDNYLTRIYSEHVLEHITYSTAVNFLKEARRALQPEGVLRIAMPDLDDLIDGYQRNWRRFDWVNWPAFAFIQTKAEMINIAFRWWGHKHLYNKEELARALSDAGFSRFYFPLPGQSDYSDLQGLETRKDSKLIAEAIKE